MTGETVVYQNALNLVPLRKFTSTEIDLFFAMCNKLKEKDCETLTLTFDELKELSSYNPDIRHMNKFVTDLQHVYSKMLNINYTIRTDNKITSFVLFYKYEIDLNEKTLQVSTAPDLKHILNELTGNFTKFELQEMTQLKSTYSKNMFRLLKQYKHTGYFKIQIDDFRERLDVPKSYKMNDINKRVLNPIIKELGFIFKDLNITKISAKKSRKIESLEFTFKPEKRIHSKRQPEMSNVGKNNQNINREMTPEWLENKKYEPIKPKTTEFTEEQQKAFLEKMNRIEKL
ncbi:RepB family plasmid replication initiator protein [Staphylococcus equorum]|uniref:Replication protein Rep n=1 Tax=Staphylococcus equorum TaxID=246432 RepID=A0AAP7IBI6_9STAP|nr:MULTISPECIES: RepB family plasmid replication initiator protein [Staphylococcus]MCM3073604.1 RepB family plasmid replication initiator protein [Staphylococcus equorum]MDK9847744.1 RepB family plasmid replication initiator protein [Staphylococcus equorum]MDK9864322.1 RepB family plasmid replication initiator protein [Staphylococcus equorum]MDK9873150.1 RepB family plasmid replication initiator protein [Staphylococcus equorum]MDN5614016.1 RepB family plasmid replication initiator protein [Sta